MGFFLIRFFYGFNKDKNVSNIVVENLQAHGKKITNVPDAKFYKQNADKIIVR
jgi:hypothetical protein